MEPTPAARRLHEPFAQALGVVGRTLIAHAEFRPETADRTFTIAMSDISEFYCLPQISARLAEVGATRNAAVSIEHDTIVPEVVRHSRLAAIFPLSASRKVDEIGAFVLEERPFDLPDIGANLHVHVDVRDDPGLEWLRTFLPSVFAAPETTV